MLVLQSRSWSPIAVGVALGLLSWFAFATVDRGLGITTPFEQAAAVVGQTVAPSNHGVVSYFGEEEQPKIGWEWMLVVGVFGGAALSAHLSRARTKMVVPPLWAARFGSSSGGRLAAAFAGGVLLMIGARIARGCTSGHGITGALQLAAASWIFIALAFAVAALAARVLYGQDGHRV